MADMTARGISIFQIAVRVADFAALTVAAEAASRLRFGVALADTPAIHVVLFYLCSIAAFFLFSRFGLYESWRGRSGLAMFGRTALTWGAVLLGGLFFSFLMHRIGELSRLWLSYWFVSGVVLIACVRWSCYLILCRLRENGYNQKSVVIVGYGPIGREMYRRAIECEWYGYEVRGIYTCGEEGIPERVKRIARQDDIPHFIEEQGIDEVWIAMSMESSRQLQEIQHLLRNVLVDIRWIPDTVSMKILSSKVGDFLGFPAVDINRPAVSELGGVVKEVFDRMFAAAALLALSPLLLAIALAIKATSPGPVIFRQPRLGLNGRRFDVYKFRSMKVHKEDNVVTQAKAGDARVTPVGRFIRSTSLDELPQFFNVLLGDMSIVGPRPHALQHNRMYSDLLEVYMLRHRVKPGITGWAQINGYRGETDTVEKMRKRVQFDLYYIQNWSMWMDLRIIAWTAFKGWTGKNAY
ncbi:MAG TPA: undecaprenyl-phosphate glucose phosphotransferase [Burkholderiaceae bacterium]